LALLNLGVKEWKQWSIRDDNEPLAYERLLDNMDRHDIAYQPQRVWAPAVEEGGHEQHNLVGEAAREVFEARVHPYLTYVRGSMRSRGREVAFEPEWVADKLRALACYESQIGLENTRAWFMDDCLREYTP
jgi:LmbE family N-acetylglucosaminyl deacetylase